jgi:hypothetical protein
MTWLPRPVLHAVEGGLPLALASITPGGFGLARKFIRVRPIDLGKLTRIGGEPRSDLRVGQGARCERDGTGDGQNSFHINFS